MKQTVDQPLPNSICPLCGGPNQCAPAGCGRFDTPCWCTEVKISQALLARVPEAQKDLACICPRCAAEAAKK